MIQWIRGQFPLRHPECVLIVGGALWMAAWVWAGGYPKAAIWCLIISALFAIAPFIDGPENG